MIGWTIFRLLLAGAICLSSFAFFSPTGDNEFAVLLLLVGAAWGLIEMLILSGLLFMYGITGIAHDIGAINERDPWHRW